MSSSHPPPKGLAATCADCEAETVARIVAWLREPATAVMRQTAGPLVFAAAIERGEWRR